MCRPGASTRIGARRAPRIGSRTRSVITAVTARQAVTGPAHGHTVSPAQRAGVTRDRARPGGPIRGGLLAGLVHAPASAPRRGVSATRATPCRAAAQAAVGSSSSAAGRAGSTSAISTTVATIHLGSAGSRSSIQDAPRTAAGGWRGGRIVHWVPPASPGGAKSRRGVDAPAPGRFCTPTPYAVGPPGAVPADPSAAGTAPYLSAQARSRRAKGGAR